MGTGEETKREEGGGRREEGGGRREEGGGRREEGGGRREEGGGRREEGGGRRAQNATIPFAKIANNSHPRLHTNSLLMCFLAMSKIELIPPNDAISLLFAAITLVFSVEEKEKND